MCSCFPYILPCLLVSLAYFWIISCYMLFFTPTQLPTLVFLLSLLWHWHHTLFYKQVSWNNSDTSEFSSWVFQSRLHLNYPTWNIASLGHGYIWIPSDYNFLLLRLVSVNPDDSTLHSFIDLVLREQDLLSDLRHKFSEWACFFPLQKVFIS